jgi:hypothetical protein
MNPPRGYPYFDAEWMLKECQEGARSAKNLREITYAVHEIPPFDVMTRDRERQNYADTFS